MDKLYDTEEPFVYVERWIYGINGHGEDIEAHLAMHGRILAIINVSAYPEVDSLIVKDTQVGGKGEPDQLVWLFGIDKMVVWRNISVQYTWLDFSFI